MASVKVPKFGLFPPVHHTRGQRRHTTQGRWRHSRGEEKVDHMVKRPTTNYLVIFYPGSRAFVYFAKMLEDKSILPGEHCAKEYGRSFMRDQEINLCKMLFTY